MTHAYAQVRLTGGPADGERVFVHEGQRRIKVTHMPVLPSMAARPRYRALPPVWIYHRDVNHPEIATYSGAEDES